MAVGVKPEVAPADVVLPVAPFGEVDEVAPNLGPRRLRRRSQGMLDLPFRADAVDQASLHHPVVKPAGPLDVMVLQVRHEDALVVE